MHYAIQFPQQSHEVVPFTDEKIEIQIEWLHLVLTFFCLQSSNTYYITF